MSDIPQEEDIPFESEVDVDESEEYVQDEDLPVEEEFDKDEYVEPKDEEEQPATKTSSKQKTEVSSVQQGESNAA